MTGVKYGIVIMIVGSEQHSQAEIDASMHPYADIASIVKAKLMPREKASRSSSPMPDPGPPQSKPH